MKWFRRRAPKIKKEMPLPKTKSLIYIQSKAAKFHRIRSGGGHVTAGIFGALLGISIIGGTVVAAKKMTNPKFAKIATATSIATGLAITAISYNAGRKKLNLARRDLKNAIEKKIRDDHVFRGDLAHLLREGFKEIRINPEGEVVLSATLSLNGIKIKAVLDNNTEK